MLRRRPYHIKMTRKRKRFFRSNIEEEITVQEQCPGAGAIMANYKRAKQIPLETWEDNYRRALVFYKTVRDSNGEIPKVPLDKAFLDKKEEDKFIADWKDFLLDLPVGIDKVTASFQQFLKVNPRNISIGQFDAQVGLFNRGWEGRDGGPLLAYNCRKRGNPGQGGLARFLNNILAGPEEKEILIQKERIFCTRPRSVYGGQTAPKKLVDVCINLLTVGSETISQARERQVVGDNEIISNRDTLYILTNDDPTKIPVYGYHISSAGIAKMPLYFNRIFSKDHIEDIHPQLAYLLWKEIGIRQKYWIKAFGGNYVPSYRVISGLEKYSEEFAALYFAMCYYNTFAGTSVVSASPIIASNPFNQKEEETAAGVGLGSPITGGENLKAVSEAMLPKAFYALPNREKYPIMLQNIRLLSNELITTIFDIAGWATPDAGFFGKKRNFAEALQAKFPGKSGSELLEEVIVWYINNPDSTPVKGFRPVEGRFFGGRYSRKHNKKHTHNKKTKKRHSRST